MYKLPASAAFIQYTVRGGAIDLLIKVTQIYIYHDGGSLRLAWRWEVNFQMYEENTAIPLYKALLYLVI